MGELSPVHSVLVSHILLYLHTYNGPVRTHQDDTSHLTRDLITYKINNTFCQLPFSFGGCRTDEV